MCHHWETRAKAARFRELQAERTDEDETREERADGTDEVPDDKAEPLVAPGDD